MLVDCDAAERIRGRAVVEELSPVDRAARQHDEVPQPRVSFADLLLGHVVPTVLYTFGDAAYAQLDGNQDHV